MKREVGPDCRPVTGDLAGLPANELAEMLDHILSEDGAPQSPPDPEIPAAFAHGGDPYSLEELLSGLEPALLLSELEPPPLAFPTGWTSDDGERHDDDGSPAAAPSSLIQDLRQADTSAPMAVVTDLAASPSTAAAEPEPEADATTQALGAVAAALQALNQPDAPAVDAAEPEPDDAVLELTGDMEIAEPEPETDATTQALGAVAAALQALNQPDAPAVDAAEPEPDDAVLELTGDMEIAEPEPEADATTQALGAVAAALQALNQPDAPAVDAAEAEPDDAVLELTGDMEIAEPEPEADATTQALGAVAAALQALAGPDAPAAEAMVEAEAGAGAGPDDDVLVLTDDFLATEAPAEPEELPPPAAPSRKAELQGEPAWDPTSLTLGNLVAALHALAEDGAPPPRAPDAEAAAAAPPSPEPAAPAEPVALPESEPEQDPAAPAAAIDEGVVADLTARIEAIIAAHHPDGTPAVAKGDPTLPDRLDALATLLADPPPTQDFMALDALTACWPKGTHDSESRALLAVAQNLSRNFGLPNKLPMASARAWRMLSPQVFEAELAQRLANVGTFIADWQKTQRTFLILEFGEIELIEQLFESLHLGYHAELLAGVMNFKVLSNRRMGLLRRIPTRAKKTVTPLLPDRKEQALIELAHAKALLERVAASGGFAPIVDTATKALEEIEKLMKAVANAGAPPPSPGGGTALGRIG